MGKGPHNPNDLTINALHKRIKEQKKKVLKDTHEQVLGKKAPEKLLPEVKDRVFNPEVFVSLCEAHCSIYEIERIMRLTRHDLKKFCLEHFGEVLEELHDRYKCATMANLRRSQLYMAEYNPTMAIFLGKVLLGQRDDLAPEENKVVGKLVKAGIDNLKKIEEAQETRAKAKKENKIVKLD